jgi:hypothetical protein
MSNYKFCVTKDIMSTIVKKGRCPGTFCKLLVHAFIHHGSIQETGLHFSELLTIVL